MLPKKKKKDREYTLQTTTVTQTRLFAYPCFSNLHFPTSSAGRTVSLTVWLKIANVSTNSKI